MDELLPVEPEFQELPPEQPNLPPNYYGTGIQPQPKKSKLPLILTIIALLLAANFVISSLALYMERETAESKPPKNDNLSPIDVYPNESDQHSHASIDGNDLTMLKDIYEHFAPSTVAIAAQDEHGLYNATGVILTKDGYILTDADFLAHRHRLQVTLFDGTVCDAALIGMDAESGMVILKIDHADLTPVSLDKGVGKQAHQILQEFLESNVRPASLNLDVSEVSQPMQIYWGLPAGIIINRINPNSSAYRAGLRVGDVLLKIGQIPLSSMGDYIEALSSYCAGETVRIYLYREGKTYYTDVCLDAA